MRRERLRQRLDRRLRPERRVRHRRRLASTSTPGSVHGRPDSDRVARTSASTRSTRRARTVPTGETEFNFQVGNFNFHSEAYSWLVVSGYKAQYKGTGSVNGVSGYDFTLTAYDGDITGGGGVGQVPDPDHEDQRRQPSSSTTGTASPTDMDTADPQAIAGGSIVIHKA